jgi:PAS domain S-box-containing protein
MADVFDQIHVPKEKRITDLPSYSPEIELGQDAAALNTVSWALIQSLDLDWVLELALETTLRVVGSQAGCIHIPDEAEANGLRLRAYIGLPADFVQCIEFIPHDDPEVQRMIASDEAIVSERCGALLKSSDGDASKAEPGTPGIWACFPLQARDRFQGLMSILVEELAPDRVGLLKTIGRYLGMAIDNAQLYRRAQQDAQLVQVERRQREVAEMLHDLVVTVNSTLDADQVLNIAVHRLRALHQATACSVSFLEEDGETFVFRATTDPGLDVSQRITFPASQSIAGRAIRERKVQVVDDVNLSSDYRAEMARRTGIMDRSLLTAPLFADGQPLGVIQVISALPNTFTQADAELLSTTAALIETAVARAQAYDRAVQLVKAEYHQREVAETLRQVAILINASLDQDTVLNRILEQLAQVVDYDSSSLMLVEGNHLTMKALRGFEEPDQVSAIKADISDNPLFQEMLASRRPILIADVKADGRFRQWAGTAPIRSWIGVPLVVRDQSIGQLSIDKHQPDFYDEEDAELVFAFAQQAAVAIQNAQLFESEQRQRGLAESLREVAAILNASLDLVTVLTRILEQLRRVVKYDSAGVLLLDGEDLLISGGLGFPNPDVIIGQRISLSSDDPAVRVFKHQHPLVIADAEADPTWVRVPGSEHIRGWMGVPLLAGEKPIGVLTLDSRKAGAYDQHHAQVIQGFADQAAIAIENAQLFEAEQRQRRMAEALHRSALALTSTMALDQVFERILSELQHVVPYDSASVQLLKGDQLEIIGGRGFPNLSELLGISFPAQGNNPNTLVLESRAPVIIADVQPLYPPFSQEPHDAADIHAWLGVPLLIGDRVIGMLALDKHQPDFYHEAYAQIAMGYAAQAAIAIENARLHQALQDYAAELEARVEARTAEVKHGHERLLAVLESAGEAIALANAEGIIEYANPAWEKLTGYGVAQAIQEKRRILDAETYPDLLVAVRNTAQSQRMWRRELINRRPDGTTYVVDLTVTPIFDDVRTLVNLVAIYRDVTQYKELDRIKSEFLSTAAHELRSPLTSILGFSELLLLRGDLSDEERSRFLKYIYDHAIHLKQLVSDLLDISRIEAGASFAVKLEPLDLCPLFEQEIHSWQEAHPDHTYELSAQGDWPQVRADKERIGQVMRNLLSNATKYSPSGGTITVSVIPVGGYVEVTVADEGLGMSSEELAHIFEKFWRADASSTAVEGTGLGLVIVKHLVEQHNGQIWVESRQGEGTAVHFTLPLVGRQTTVLIVEDEDSVREIEHRILTNNGIATLLASTGQQAIEMAQAHRPDLVLLDLMMPGMSGQDVLHALKSHPATQHIPILIISARASWPTIEESYMLGAVDFVTKPFEYQELLSRVRRALKLAAGARQQAISSQPALPAPGTQAEPKAPYGQVGSPG